MSHSDLPSEDDFELIDPNDDFDDDQEKEWLDLDEGEHVIGEIRGLNPNCGDNDTTVIELTRGLGAAPVIRNHASYFMKQERREHDLATTISGASPTKNTTQMKASETWPIRYPCRPSSQTATTIQTNLLALK